MTTYDQLAQFYYSGGWHLVDEIVRNSPGVDLERGVAEDLDIKPSMCTFRLGDDDDTYRPSNAASDLYGITGAWMRAAYATAGQVMLVGDTLSMTPGQSPDMQDSGGTVVRGDRWVDVKFSGPLGRVGKWRDPLDPPLLTTILGDYGANLRGYWPMQDGRDATVLANYYAGGKPGTFSGVQLAAAAGPGGSDDVLETSTTSKLAFEYAPMSTTAGWQMVFAVYVPTADVTERVVWQWRTTSGHQWQWKVSSTTYRIEVQDSTGASVASLASTHGTGAGPGQWITFRIKVTASGGTVTIEPAWYAEFAPSYFGFTTTYSGVMGAPTTGGMVGTSVVTDGARYGHHFVLSGGTDDLVDPLFTDAFAGYRSETAADRFTRLCTSRGLPYQLRGTASESVEMGPQPIATFLDLLKEIRQTERGLIFDRGVSRGVVFCTYGYLREQAADPALDLTWPDDIAPPLLEDPATDQAFNLITLQNTNGTTAVAELATGRLGTEDPPDGSGRLDKKIDVNMYDETLMSGYANWWMRYYTQGATRFSTVVVDVDSTPSLLATVKAMEPGQFIRLTGRTPDPLLLLVLSIGVKSTRNRLIFTFTVAPGEIFSGGVYGTAKYQGSATVLDEALDATETGIDVKSDAAAYSAGWSTTGTPYDWVIGGERVTVTSITAPVSSSGYWTQTATVTRSVNGVVKSHATGAAVKLADPSHW